MKKRRRKRSPPKVSRYRRVVGRLSHSMLAMAVVTTGLIFGLASVGWATNGKSLLVGQINTATQKTVLDQAGAGPALELQVDSGPALAVNTKAMVPNLNADLLDDKDASEFATQSALSAEETARETADQTLQNNIDAEAQDRADADTTLQAKIDAEAQDRSNADNQLKTDLATASGDPNQPGDQVDWSNLKGVPQGFADGEDAVGSSDPNAGLSGYEIVENSSPYDTFPLKGAQAECTSGKEVIGGGGAYSNNADGLQANGDDNIAIQWSRPFTLAGPNGQSGYTVMAGDVSTPGGESSPRSWRAIAWAICADVTSP